MFAAVEEAAPEAETVRLINWPKAASANESVVILAASKTSKTGSIGKFKWHNAGVNNNGWAGGGLGNEVKVSGGRWRMK